MSEPTGVEALKKKLRQENKSITWLADQLSITRGAISQWDRVPAERIGEISNITGLPHKVLRPDLFEAA